MDTSMDCPQLVNNCWITLYQRQCRESCGLCDGSDCVDHLAYCNQYSKPCNQPVALQCPLYCGICTNNSTTVPLGTKTTVPLGIKTTVPLLTKGTTTVPQTTKTTLLTTKTTKTTTTTKATKPPPPCKDTSPNCPTWAKNGFCTNTFYPPEKRKEYCAKTCKYC
uniref:ShKT domain-containing protein n=1 Tax=Caenorhabditis tropicalis TaxID=1561998 RepID=A0A1I7UZ16_9PELO